MRPVRVSLITCVLALAAIVALPAAAHAVKCGGKKAKIVGTPGNDKIRIKGNGGGKQVVYGGGGDDTIITGKGGDIVCGGPGDDTLLPGRGADKAFGGDGDDYIKNEKGNDRLYGDAGNDQVLGGPSKDYVSGGSGNDTVGGATDRDEMHGDAGDDLLLGDDGSDTMYGEEGNDILRGGAGGEDMFGGNGNDRLFGELLDDDMDGEGGDDILIGAHGIDAMKGGSGDDWLRGGTNKDDYAGGGGTDTASFAPAMPSDDIPNPQGVTVSLPAGLAQGPGGQDTLSGLENVNGSAFNDDITGDAADNVIDAGPGDDDVVGGGGADTMYGGLGDDLCDADPSDVAIPSGEQRCGLGIAEDVNDPRPLEAFVSMQPGGPDPGVFVVGADPSYTAGSQSESLSVVVDPAGVRVTSAGAVTADPGQRSGCDQQDPGTVVCPIPAGSLGWITMFGDTGDDTLNVGDGFPALMTTDVSGGNGSDTMNGSAGADVMFSGRSGNDVFHGEGGEDALIAEGTGGDVLDGGADNDQLVTDDPCQGHDYRGGAGYDIAGFGRYELAISSPGSRGVKAQLGGTATDPSRGNCQPTQIRADNEILEGSAGNDTLLGNGQDNPLILGREGDDVIRGGAGADQLVGSGGADSLYGEGGLDVLDAADGQADKVIDCGANGGSAFTDGPDPRAKNCGKGAKKGKFKGRKKKKR